MTSNDPGKALPRLDPVGREVPDPAGLVLLAHGGRSGGHESGERRRLTYWRMLPFARNLHRAAPELGVSMLRYRHRGWNGPDRDAQRDAESMLTELRRRHPGVPIVLVGHSMGGRAVLRAAGADGVVAVCALAPWLDGTDPVAQLAGRSVLIAHGDRERMTDPARSLAYAIRAKTVTDRVARFEVLGDGHSMLRRAGDWTSLVRRFVLGELEIEPPDPDITNAMRLPAPAGLTTVLTGAAR
ncbi:MAG: lysophospholipase [Pseudonocardia sp.]|nr:lysophospholipase [Pseudonocardia sp.]